MAETPEEIVALRARPKLSRGKEVKVIVIGAGAAGLATAYELEQRGFTVTVLEAERLHIGGRIRTRRDDGLYGEFGAMRIPKTHDFTRYYAEEVCGLTLREFVQLNFSAFVSSRGAVSTIGKPEKVIAKYKLEANELISPLYLWSQIMKALKGQTPEDVQRNIEEHELTVSGAIDLDRKSLYDHLSGPLTLPGIPGWGTRQLSDEALKLMVGALGLDSTLHHSLTERLREEWNEIWDSFKNPFSEIEGGSSLLPEKLQDLLQGEVVRDSPVVAVEHGEGAVTAVVDQSGVERRYNANWLVCTAPLGPTSAIKFTPALPAELHEAIGRIHYSNATKVLVRCTRRFWEERDKIFGGGSSSDGALGTTWYPSDNAEAQDPDVSAKPAMLLASYSWGERARRMSKHASKELITRELAVMHKTLLDHPDYIEQIYVWSWDCSSRWSNGAYASYMPGEHHQLHKYLVAKRDSRVLFAGEHTSLNHSWIQGALKSAARVVGNICDEEKLV